jgi:hypothetical protein
MDTTQGFAIENKRHSCKKSVFAILFATILGFFFACRRKKIVIAVAS